MNRKEQLQKELNAIVEAENAQFITEYYPTFQAMEGKYFKTENGYGHDNKWYVYTKITSIAPEELYVSYYDRVLSMYKGFSFEKTSDGFLIFKKNRHDYVHCLGKEITEAEFNSCFEDFKSELP